MCVSIGSGTRLASFCAKLVRKLVVGVSFFGIGN